MRVAFRQGSSPGWLKDPKSQIAKPLKEPKEWRWLAELRPNWTRVGYFAQN